jgi:tetratricopeptide (TPR) repeat protein
MLKALDVNPDNYPVWEQLILLDSELQDFEKMAAHSDKAIQLFPSQPLIYVLNAVANIQLENYEDALKTLEGGQIYVADNKRMEAQFELYRAEAYYNLDETEKAFSSFEKVIEIDPENFMAMNNYAYYLSVLGTQLEKAEKMSSLVIKANPKNPTYLDTHAWVLFQKGEYRLAKFYMDTAMENGGDESTEVVEHYGDIHYKLDDIENALKYWKKSLEMGNDSPILKQKIEEKKYIEGEE